MANQRRAFDWEIFWFREVLFLSLPWLIVVFTLRRGDYIHHVRLVLVLSIQLCLTILNILWTLVASDKLEKTEMTNPAYSTRYNGGPEPLGLDDLQGKSHNPTAKFPVQSEFGRSVFSDSCADKEAG
jgi:hypothetical protein